MKTLSFVQKLSVLISILFSFGYTQANHLLIAEFCVAPQSKQYISIFNPTGSTVDLTNYYISDNNTYYLITTGGQVIQASDFLLRFPASSTIASGATMNIAVSANDYSTAFGIYPEYEFGKYNLNGSIPDLEGTATISSAFSSSSEMLVLFYWNGSSDLVQDVDYVAYGITTSLFSDKSGIMVGSSTYVNDVPVASQQFVTAPISGKCAKRTVTSESGETSTGGNGITNHNETSETFSTVFITTDNANPSFPALPVEMTSFTAIVHNKNVELEWETITEVNNYGFEVERLAIRDRNLQGDSHFVWGKVGFVEGNGTTNTPKQYSFADKNLALGKYFYRLKQIDRDGKFEYSKEIEVTVSSTPKEFVLEQNYPNPFNPSTVIRYQSPGNSHITLKVYDAIGREVTTLVDEVKEAGLYSVVFDAARLTTGMYFARLSSDGKSRIRKLLLMK